MRYQGKHTTQTKAKWPVILIGIAVGTGLILFGALLAFLLGDKKTDAPSPTVEERELNDLTAECFSWEGPFYTYTAGEGKIGIDISSHQGRIDFEQLRAAGVEVAIVRIGGRGYTQGGIFRDDSFHDNVVGAHAVGIETGAYFFSQATTVEEAVAEAEAVCEWIAPYDMTYPVMYDWERQINGRTAEVSYATVTECAKAFCDILMQHDYRAGVYFNLEMSYYMDMQELEPYSLWLAQYADCPSYPYRLDGWQYSNEGVIEGISGTVDLDLFFE